MLKKLARKNSVYNEPIKSFRNEFWFPHSERVSLKLVSKHVTQLALVLLRNFSSYLRSFLLLLIEAFYKCLGTPFNFQHTTVKLYHCSKFRAVLDKIWNRVGIPRNGKVTKH